MKPTRIWHNDKQGYMIGKGAYKMEDGHVKTIWHDYYDMAGLHNWQGMVK